MEIPQHLWSVDPGWLNTASYGLPPKPAWDALQAALAGWRRGSVSWESWDVAVNRARASFARLIGVPEGDVAIGAQVSQLLAPIAAAIPDGGTVMLPEIEFTSNVFPWAVHADRGVTIRTAPVAKLAEHIDGGVDVVAFGLVQSANGEIVDYPGVVAAARAAGAWVVVNAMQATGWLPYDGLAADAVVCGAYKWLMGPRGTAFAYLSPPLRERMRPTAAGWYAGADPYDSYYGMPLRLAQDARAFDISPAWHPWVGTAPALEVIEQVGLANIHAHNVSLANPFLTGLGQPPGDSAIVTVNVPGAEEKFAAAGVRAAVRHGRVRASFHVYTTFRCGRGPRSTDMKARRTAGAGQKSRTQPTVVLSPIFTWPDLPGLARFPDTEPEASLVAERRVPRSRRTPPPNSCGMPPWRTTSRLSIESAPVTVPTTMPTMPCRSHDSASGITGSSRQHRVVTSPARCPLELVQSKRQGLRSFRFGGHLHVWRAALKPISSVDRG